MKILTLATAALLLAAPLLATPAGAQPPAEGTVGPLTQPSILCDTSNQLQSIVDAFEKGADVGQARFVELFHTKNGKHEPTCAIVPVRLAIAVDSTPIGRIKISGQDVYGWIVHIKNDVGDGYYLYLESPMEALKNTI